MPTIFRRIKNMTIDEMSTFLDEVANSAYCDTCFLDGVYCKDSTDIDKCIANRKKWLQQQIDDYEEIWK